MKVRDLVKELTDAGFERVRTRGSHATYQHPDGRKMTVVINHMNADAKIGIVKNMRAVKEGRATS